MINDSKSRGRKDDKYTNISLTKDKIIKKIDNQIQKEQARYDYEAVRSGRYIIGLQSVAICEGGNDK